MLTRGVPNYRKSERKRENQRAKNEEKNEGGKEGKVERGEREKVEEWNSMPGHVNQRL